MYQHVKQAMTRILAGGFLVTLLGLGVVVSQVLETGHDSLGEIHVDCTFCHSSFTSVDDLYVSDAQVFMVVETPLPAISILQAGESRTRHYHYSPRAPPAVS